MTAPTVPRPAAGLDEGRFEPTGPTPSLSPRFLARSHPRLIQLAAAAAVLLAGIGVGHAATTAGHRAAAEAFTAAQVTGATVSGPCKFNPERPRAKLTTLTPEERALAMQVIAAAEDGRALAMLRQTNASSSMSTTYDADFDYAWMCDAADSSWGAALSSGMTTQEIKQQAGALRRVTAEEFTTVATAANCGTTDMLQDPYDRISNGPKGRLAALGKAVKAGEIPVSNPRLQWVLTKPDGPVSKLSASLAVTPEMQAPKYRPGSPVRATVPGASCAPAAPAQRIVAGSAAGR